MGKVTWTGLPPPDDPIFKEGLTISNAGSPKSIVTSPAATDGAPQPSSNETDWESQGLRKPVSDKELMDAMFQQLEAAHRVSQPESEKRTPEK